MGLQREAHGSTQGEIINVYSPVDELMATVKSAENADYEKVIQKASEAYKEWRTIPAPLRGEVIRQLAEKLKKKEPLGRLFPMKWENHYKKV